MNYPTKSFENNIHHNTVVEDSVKLIINLPAKTTPDFLIKVDKLIESHFHQAEISYTIGQQNPKLDMDFSLSQKYGAKIIEVLQINDEWLAAIAIYVIKNLSNHQFSGEYLAEAMNLSSRQLRRKIKAINGQSTQDFVNDIRYALAKEIIINEADIKFSQISEYLGFRKRSYFIKNFEKRFGFTPELI